jgi:hypothetical protein
MIFTTKIDLLKWYISEFMYFLNNSIFYEIMYDFYFKL